MRGTPTQCCSVFSGTPGLCTGHFSAKRHQVLECNLSPFCGGIVFCHGVGSLLHAATASVSGEICWTFQGESWWHTLNFSGWILVEHPELFRMNPGGTHWTFQDKSWWNTLNFSGWIHDVVEHQCLVLFVILKWCHHFVVMMLSVYDVILWYVISFGCYYALMKFLFPSGAVMTSLLFGETRDSTFLPG